MTGRTLRLVERLAEAWPEVERRERTIVVAVSGGADSVALLHGLVELQPRARLIAAHFHHGLRGAAADADAAFVAEVCRGLNVLCAIGRAQPGEVSGGDGLEAAARDARYRFLAEVAREHGARYLAVAHTWNDQAETILHRLLRGTGLDGLAGIPRVRPLNEWTTLVRPLLAVPREIVLEFLHERKLPYRHDGTNDDVDLTRNRIRHELLPLLARDYNPRAADALVRLGTLAEETQAFVQSQLDPLYAAVVKLRSDGAVVDVRALARESPFVIRTVLARLWREADWPRQEMSFTQWERLEALLRTKLPATCDLPGRIRVTLADGVLRCERLRD